MGSNSTLGIPVCNKIKPDSISRSFQFFHVYLLVFFKYHKRYNYYTYRGGGREETVAHYTLATEVIAAVQH